MGKLRSVCVRGGDGEEADRDGKMALFVSTVEQNLVFKRHSCIWKALTFLGTGR